MGALYTRLWEKFAILDRNLRLSQKRYEIIPYVVMIANRKSLVADQSVSVPMTLSDLERRDAKDHIFPADPRNYAHTV